MNKVIIFLRMSIVYFWNFSIIALNIILLSALSIAQLIKLFCFLALFGEGELIKDVLEKYVKQLVYPFSLVNIVFDIRSVGCGCPTTSLAYIYNS